MRIEFTTRDHGPKNLLAEAEIFFDSEDGILRGTKLTGFTLWRTDKGEPQLTMPARSWGDGGERKFFDLLRSGDGGVEDLRACKASIVAAWKAGGGKRVTFVKGVAVPVEEEL